MAAATTPMRIEPDDDDDLKALAAEQRLELMESEVLESDLNFAFDLQLQEAINASLAIQPSSSSAPAPPSPLQTTDDFFNFSSLQAEELDKFERERRDRLIAEAEMKRMREDLYLRVHDQSVAGEINGMTEEEWQEYGDNFERPFGEGSSAGGSAPAENFRVYFKALMDKLVVQGSEVVVGGIGVAICDSRDDLVFQVTKPLNLVGYNRRAAELQALIEGLKTAIDLDLKRVVFYTDFLPLFQFIIGRWQPKQQKILTLLDQVDMLRGKFIFSEPAFVARNDVKYAFKLAREAIVSQIQKPSGSSCDKNILETCVICMEDTDVRQIFSVDDCLHRYCFSCMRQHVEAKLLNGIVPKCPHEGCTSVLKIQSCDKFLTPKLLEIMSQRMKEASIPAAEKIYCPYPKCSALMSKGEVFEYSRSAALRPQQSAVRKCKQCDGLFCIYCKVPWHQNMTCFEYKRRNPFPAANDLKLKNLADRNLWRQCMKCNHLIELAAGCYHMTCRCGYEFCYTCGAEWKNKRATCSCPLWNEDNILHQDDYSDDEEEDEDGVWF